MTELNIQSKLTIPYSADKPSSPAAMEVFVLRQGDSPQILLPGEALSMPVPSSVQTGVWVAYEPYIQNIKTLDCSWPPQDVAEVNQGRILIPNNRSHAISLHPHQHVARVYPVISETKYAELSVRQRVNPNAVSFQQTRTDILPIGRPFSTNVSVDPDHQLTTSDADRFQRLNRQFDDVFNPKISVYNDASGVIRAYVNIGNVEPPPSKARNPLYDLDKLDLLQTKCDELEAMGVLGKPEEEGITLEHVNPCFLVKKPSGDHRLVTSFNGLTNFVKPPPSRVQDVNEVLRFLAGWKFVIKSDMKDQFYQLKMRRDSMKYLGVMTPFKGLRIYRRAVMGCPGSSEFLDTLMSRVLGDLLHKGVVCKLADDLYIGGDTVDELLQTWQAVLSAFQKNDLRLSATKTVICPLEATILGWHWSQGAISLTPHRVTPLATVEPPKTVKGLRSWIGSVKYLSTSIQCYSTLLAPLEATVGKRPPAEHVHWTEELLKAFRVVQAKLRSIRPITVPRRSDKLIITTDASIRYSGLAAVLFVLRDGAMLLGGYYSAKLKDTQVRWLPCELEALAIGAAVDHWKVYIMNSWSPVQILTDSKPCIQAFRKLCLGQFSASACISTFLAVLSQYRVTMQHISGVTNLPADYGSRNPAECQSPTCQICSFVREASMTTVRAVSVDDILNNRTTMPFLTSTAWKQTQQECKDLRKAYMHLKNGTRPPKKSTHIRDMRTYLRLASINREGLMVVPIDVPFAAPIQRIVVPRHILPGLLTALHLRLSHPSNYQLRRAFDRHFFALNADDAMKNATHLCAHCESLATLPAEKPQFSTSEHPASPGIHFASDVLRRSGQAILVTRDYFSSFTTACICSNEGRDSIRDALIQTVILIKMGGLATVRVDCAAAMQSLVNDQKLQECGINVDLGRVKNPNKNPVAEKAIGELEVELRKSFPGGETVSQSDLSIVLHVLNSRIRNRCIRASEILFQRDYVSGAQLTFKDAELSNEQMNRRAKNHEPSAVSKCPKARSPVDHGISPGSLVFVKSDGSKHIARDRYLITSSDDDYVYGKKLVGSQFRAKSYKLKRSEVYPVPNNIPVTRTPVDKSPSVSDYDSDNEPGEVEGTDNDSDSCHPPAPNLVFHAARPQRSCREPARISRKEFER